MKRTEMAKFIDAKEFVLFRAGKYPQGTYTEADLDEMVLTFDANEQPHIIIGHSSDYPGRTRIPSFGLIGGLKRVGNELIATATKFHEKLAHWINEGFYDQRSVEIAEEPGKPKRLLALGMLGACPPAVKGLPAMDEALNEVAINFAEEQTKPIVVEFAGGEIDFEEVKAALSKDTYEECSESCAMFLVDLEVMLGDGDPNPDELRGKIWTLNDALMQAVGLHSAAVEKIESVKAGLMEKAKEMAVRLFKHNVKKEIDMDSAKEKEYQDKIAVLDAQVKEFAGKEKAASEAKAKADAEAADLTIKGEIKSFCEALAKDGKFIKADEEAGIPDEMFKMAKAGVDYKKIFASRGVVVPLGEMKINPTTSGEVDKRPKKIQDAEKYVESHQKEFASLTPAQALSKALQLEANGKIKFS